jgi:hypothetical protein
MRPITALRTPYGSTTIIRSHTTGRIDEAHLASATVLAKLVLVLLCAARVSADWLRGHATIEGGVALALLVAFAMWLGSESRGANRRAAQADGDTPYRSASPQLVGGSDVRPG